MRHLCAVALLLWPLSVVAIDATLPYSGVGSCTNQFVTALNADSAPTCGGITSSFSCTGLACTGQVSAQTTSSAALVGEINASTTNSSETVLQLNRFTSGTAAAGIGASLAIRSEDASGNQDNIGAVHWSLSDVTNGSEDAQLKFTLFGGGSLRDAISFAYDTSSGHGHLDIRSTGQASSKVYVDLSNDAAADYDVRLSLDGDDALILTGGRLLVQTAEVATAAPGVAMSGGLSGNSGVEIREDSGGGTPYLDWSNDTSVDYDARLILTGDNTLLLDGAVQEFSASSNSPRQLGTTNLITHAAVVDTTASSCTPRAYGFNRGTCTRSGAGDYTITYSSALASGSYVPMCNILGAADYCCNVFSHSSTQLRVRVTDCSGAAVDGITFTSMAIGP